MENIKEFKRELNKKFEEYCDNSLNIYGSVLTGMVNDYFKRINTVYDKETWNKPIELVSELAESLDRQKVAVCIGSGVTVQFVGTWDDLLNKLMKMRCFDALHSIDNEAFSQEINQITFADIDKCLGRTKIPGSNANYLERGEYLMYDSGDNSSLVYTANETAYREQFFAEQVRQAILSGTDEFLEEFEQTAKDNNRTALAEYFIQTYCTDKQNNIEIPDNGNYSTLSGVVQLCIKKNVKEIIIYNFDTVVDHLIADPNIRSIYGQPKDEKYIYEIYSFTDIEPVLTLPEGRKADKDTVVYKIYHVHGIADKDCKTKNLIFSENSYQSYQRTALNWSNIHQADIMSRNDVLCVGFSGDDSNFRMLRHFLDDTDKNPVMGTNKEKRTKMYLMKDYSGTLKDFVRTGLSDKEQLCTYAIIKTYYDMVNTYFARQLNTNIIWSNGFNNMAKQLVSLANIKFPE